MKSNDCATPKTPYRRTQPTPRPQWSLPRTHYTFTDSPFEGEASDIDDDDVVNESFSYDGALPLGFTDTDNNKENVSCQHVDNNPQQEKITQPKSDQQPIVSVADKSREQQLAQKCFDSAMEIMSSDTFSAISSGNETPKNKATSSDDLGINRSIDSFNRDREHAALEFINTISMTPSGEDNTEEHTPPASTQEENEPEHSNKVAVAQSPNESTTLSGHNCEAEDREVVVRSPIPSLANSFAPTEVSSVAASSVVNDLFAALRTTCSTVCEGENDEVFHADNHLSPIHPQEAGLTTERKRWIQKTLLNKKEYTPYQTKEREECCKNKDSHELTTERKRWIEKTLLAQAQDTLRKLSPTQTHSSFLATALAAEASNEMFTQQKRQIEEPVFDEARDESTMKSPQQCHQLDNSFLASALQATNMLLTPTRRERDSSKPSRPRMSIGATPLPFASPFSPSSAASSAFTETASNIILHAMKQLTPKLSATKTKQGKKKQKTITPPRKSDLLSIVAEMDYLNTVASHGSKDEPRSHCDQTKLVERVEKLEHLITSQYSQGLENRQEEINELRRELYRSKQQLENERQLVEEANLRASILMSNLKASREVHSNVERQLREKILSLEVEVECLRGQKQFAFDQAERTNGVALESKNASSLADKYTDLDELRRANIELLERQRITDTSHRECTKENENLRSQLLALSNVSSALDNLRSFSESFSCIKQKLEEEVSAKRFEVNCMQRSLEFMSCELIESTNEVKDLRSENARLHEELKRMKAGKKWFSLI